MREINAAVVPLGVRPPEGAELVVLADSNSYVSESLAPQFLAAAARYAKKYGVWLVSQRFLANDSLCLCLLSPDGKPVGVSRATHLNLDYRSLRLHRADEIEVFDTDIGKIAMLVDVDIQMPHVVRQAALKGAEIIVASQFIQPYDFFEDRVVLGAKSAVGSNGVPVVAAVGSRGVIAAPDRDEVTSPFEEASIMLKIAPQSVTDENRAQMLSAQNVLRAHKFEILTLGGEENVL